MTLVFSLMDMSQENTITATYDGLEVDIYYFTDDDGNTYSFQGVEDAVLKSYNLSDESLVGRNFKVIYIIKKELDGDTDDTYENYIITGLSLID